MDKMFQDLRNLLPVQDPLLNTSKVRIINTAAEYIDWLSTEISDLLKETKLADILSATSISEPMLDSILHQSCEDSCMEELLIPDKQQKLENEEDENLINIMEWAGTAEDDGKIANKVTESVSQLDLMQIEEVPTICTFGHRLDDAMVDGSHSNSVGDHKDDGNLGNRLGNDMDSGSRGNRKCYNNEGSNRSRLDDGNHGNRLGTQNDGCHKSELEVTVDDCSLGNKLGDTVDGSKGDAMDDSRYGNRGNAVDDDNHGNRLGDTMDNGSHENGLANAMDNSSHGNGLDDGSHDNSLGDINNAITLGNIADGGSNSHVDSSSHGNNQNHAADSVHGNKTNDIKCTLHGYNEIDSATCNHGNTNDDTDDENCNSIDAKTDTLAVSEKKICKDNETDTMTSDYHGNNPGNDNRNDHQIFEDKKDNLNGKTQNQKEDDNDKNNYHGHNDVNLNIGTRDHYHIDDCNLILSNQGNKGDEASNGCQGKDGETGLEDNEAKNDSKEKEETSDKSSGHGVDKGYRKVESKTTDRDNGPRRPQNGFIRFSCRFRKDIAEKHPNFDNREISRILGAKWRRMTKEEKKPFSDEFNDEMKQRREEFPDWNYAGNRKKSSEALMESEPLPNRLRPRSMIKPPPSRTSDLITGKEERKLKKKSGKSVRTRIEKHQWVQCDRCDKWRHLPVTQHTESLPDQWFCAMNPDTSFSDCNVPEIPWSEDVDIRISLNNANFRDDVADTTGFLATEGDDNLVLDESMSYNWDYRKCQANQFLEDGSDLDDVVRYIGVGMGNGILATNEALREDENDDDILMSSEVLGDLDQYGDDVLMDGGIVISHGNEVSMNGSIVVSNGSDDLLMNGDVVIGNDKLTQPDPYTDGEILVNDGVSSRLGMFIGGCHGDHGVHPARGVMRCSDGEFEDSCHRNNDVIRADTVTGGVMSSTDGEFADSYHSDGDVITADTVMSSTDGEFRNGCHGDSGVCGTNGMIGSTVMNCIDNGHTDGDTFLCNALSYKDVLSGEGPTAGCIPNELSHKAEIYGNCHFQGVSPVADRLLNGTSQARNGVIPAANGILNGKGKFWRRVIPAANDVLNGQGEIQGVGPAAINILNGNQVQKGILDGKSQFRKEVIPAAGEILSGKAQFEDIIPGGNGVLNGNGHFADHDLTDGRILGFSGVRSKRQQCNAGVNRAVLVGGGVLKDEDDVAADDTANQVTNGTLCVRDDFPGSCTTNGFLATKEFLGVEDEFRDNYDVIPLSEEKLKCINNCDKKRNGDISSVNVKETNFGMVVEIDTMNDRHMKQKNNDDQRHQNGRCNGRADKNYDEYDFHETDPRCLNRKIGNDHSHQNGQYSRKDLNNHEKYDLQLSDTKDIKRKTSKDRTNKSGRYYGKEDNNREKWNVKEEDSRKGRSVEQEWEKHQAELKLWMTNGS
ncbi:uncharacterized protein LOC144450055 [Glandiceps talaboti]